MASYQSRKITPHLSDQANKLKALLQLDDERRRKDFIRNLAERPDQATPLEGVNPLVTNQKSVENQLQEQVTFYESALSNLQKRSEEIAIENKSLYEKMNQSIVDENDKLSSDEDGNNKRGPSPRFSSSRPKERLLRTKAEVSDHQVRSGMVVNESFSSLEDILSSVDEPGQVTNMNYNVLQQREDKNDMLDFEDLSSASEGQFIGQFSVAANRDESRDARTVMLVGSSPSSSGRQQGVIRSVETNGFARTNELRDSKKVTFDVGTSPDESSSGIQQSNELKQAQSMVNEIDEMLNVGANHFPTSEMIDHLKLGEAMKQAPSGMNVNGEMLHGGSDTFQTSATLDHVKLQEEMMRMQMLYDTKARHLEVLLQSGRKQIEEQQKEITDLRGEIRLYKTPVKEGASEGHCCSSDIMNKPEKSGESNLLQKLLLEREELFEAIKRQQFIVAEGNRHETEAYYHVKQSCEMVEQVQLEKQELAVRVKQLEGDVDDYKERVQALQKTHQEEMVAMSKKFKQNMDEHIEALNNKVEEQSRNLTVLEVHMQKTNREKIDLKNELDKAEAHNASQHSKSTALLEQSQKEVMEALKRQTLAEHETGKVRLETKLREKRQQQEIEQQSMEVAEFKRRLHATEDNLTMSQESLLEVTNELNACKQQLQLEISQGKMMAHTFDEEKKRLIEDANEKAQNLTRLLMEREARDQLSKEELTKMLESKSSIISKYQNECKVLNENVVAEQKQYHMNINQLVEKCNQLELGLGEMADRNDRKDVLLDSYKQQTENAEEALRQKKEEVMLLMSKQSAILRDRYLLSKEVELLKTQLHTSTL